jgi:hypothetical protein
MRNTTKDPVVRVAAVRGTVAVLAATSLALGVSPSHAAPTKLGPVTGLDLTISKPDSRYAVASDWDDLTGATAYRVSLTNAGTVLQSDKVTASNWTSTTTLGAGNTVTVKVVPLVGKRPGKPATVSEDLPDVTKPVGTFHVVQESPGSQHVTVVQDTLSDDLTSPDEIVRTISWDQGMPAEAWNDDGSHTYTEDLRAYQPSVTLKDAAGNERVVSLGTVVVGDHTPPTGDFEAEVSGWARWNIALDYTTELGDNFSDPDKVTCTVAWGDDSTDTWTGGATPRHKYVDAGTYEATVTLADEAGNTATLPVITVKVAADTARPTVKLTKPARLKSVRAWKRLKGKASDVDGTGVRNVKVRIVEKRNGRWFAYRAPSRTWVKGGSSKATALQRSRVAKVVPVDGVWRYRVAGLRKGAIVVKVRGTDNVGNRSKARTYSQLLSRR